MVFGRYVCAATSTGAIEFLDPETLQIITTWQAHSGEINSMDARNQFLITCGSVNRGHGLPSLETYAKVYDLKNMKIGPLISFPAGAAVVKMHPKLSTTCVIASQTGQVRIIDILNQDNQNINYASWSTYLVGLDISPSGAAWVMKGGDGGLYLWDSGQSQPWVEYAEPVEHADVVPDPPKMGVDSELYDNHI